MINFNLFNFIVQRQIAEIEEENKLFDLEQTNDNISDMLARQKQRENFK